MKRSVAITLALLLVTMFSVTARGPLSPSTRVASAACNSSPTVTTDQQDYSAGQTALISGSGFPCDAALTVTVTPPHSAMSSISVTTDGTGAFTTRYQIGTVDVAGKFKVNVLDGSDAVLASTVFYDSHFRFTHVTYVKTGPTSVNFTVKSAFRRDGYGCVDPTTTASAACSPGDGHPQVGDFFLESIGDTTLGFGDTSSAQRLAA